MFNKGLFVTDITGVQVYRIDHDDWTIQHGFIQEHEDYNTHLTLSCYVMMQGDKMTTFDLD